ncbi:TIGR02266 family protein [Geomonas sp.]|uniref:TIGR02266 family protein n=1 Tax=Geomonas sp. TaxID=2651584 RepID=UPI002B476F39|nr:TIGR02266 family protein [Geomonas sp.]HJV33929.1 TIGR02266 family protein [Geomonas sp.]
MTTKRILLVDDVQLFLEQQASFLDRKEFELIYARSGVEALKIAHEARPELILMDFYLPDMNGDRCCRVIKESLELRGTPLVMVTAGVDEQDFEKSWAAGCDDIIVKPINGHYFRAVVRKYLPVTERQEPRYVARLHVRYRQREQDLVLDDYSINLSTGGLFLETVRVLEVGTALKLSFQLPEREQMVVCHGRIAWLNHPDMIRVQSLPPGMGIQFLDLSMEGLEAIREFIKNGALLPYW